MKFNKVYIELTNICGLACTFCPTKELQNKTMDLDFFETIVSQVKKYTNTILYHIFGDPLTLSNLKEYLEITHKYNLKVEIVTTGYYLKNFDLELFLHPAIKQINFSLNSFNKNDLSMSLDTYLKPIFDLCDLKLKNKIHSFINFRLWNLDSSNKSDIEFNKKVLQKISKHFEINLDALSTSKPTRVENQILIDFDSYFEWPTLSSTNNTNAPCYGLRSHFGILSNGTVVPCCLDSYGIIALGNLHDTTLDNILQSKRVDNIINGFKKGIAVEELCKKCTFKERFLPKS